MARNRRESLRSKGKGYAGEIEWRDRLIAEGFQAKRRIMSGVSNSEPGDVVSKKLGQVGSLKLWEVKRRRSLPKWMVGFLGKSKHIYGVAAREDGRGSPWLVVVRADALFTLIGGNRNDAGTRLG